MRKFKLNDIWIACCHISFTHRSRKNKNVSVSKYAVYDIHNVEKNSTRIRQIKTAYIDNINFMKIYLMSSGKRINSNVKWEQIFRSYYEFGIDRSHFNQTKHHFFILHTKIKMLYWHSVRPGCNHSEWFHGLIIQNKAWLGIEIYSKFSLTIYSIFIANVK